MDKISDCMNRLALAMELKDFMTMERVYDKIKKEFGALVFEEERKGNIRFCKNLRYDTFFAEIINGCAELPKEGIAYLGITKNSPTGLHFFRDGYMIVSVSRLRSRFYHEDAFFSTPIAIDVDSNLLTLPPTQMKQAGLCEGDILKVDIDT
ncbi:MAG: hypothetical protein HFI90_10965, partial [Clostridia bacterium]|nr:hypothetical protein [Clostridia bacterium]